MGPIWPSPAASDPSKTLFFPKVFQRFRFPPMFASPSPVLTYMTPSWPHLGPSWRHLGASWGFSRVSLGRLGNLLWPPWAILGASLEPSLGIVALETAKDRLKIASWSPSSSKDHPRCRHDDFSCLLDPNLGSIWPSPAASDPSKQAPGAQLNLIFDPVRANPTDVSQYLFTSDV